ncbi:SagB-type dehydrogenase family enzyme [Kitasatospora sp. MAP12-15]|uniref:SagB family peptide dehydrogenase n=1 Tax=unclassified Kitasatospora TaxID=2633591 RepID=UPI0024772D07|nr:SagB family peptide dehydrogenase [Kitasatospora sp. MAP12-44]MDH6110621.1 SagB-type dehydrogenase family enzyme [Kitasatospora sp. MAP12-44]
MRPLSGDETPALRLLASLTEDVHVEFSETDEDILLHSRWSTHRVTRPDRTTREALRRMSFGPISLRNVLEDGDSAAKERLEQVLEDIQHLVVRSIGLTDTEIPLLSASPMTPQARLGPHRIDPDQPIRLSRFATLHSEGDGFVMESPLSLFRVKAHRAAAADLLGALSWTTTLEDLLKGVPLHGPAVAEIVAQLLATGMAIAAQAPQSRSQTEARFAEDNDPVLAAWSPVDLLFHTRSTTGRHNNDFGATFAQLGRSAPAPAVKPTPAGPRYALPQPGPAGQSGSSGSSGQDAAHTSLFALLDAPWPTIRPDAEHDELTIDQLGELLYRSMRVRSVDTQPAGPIRYEVSDRPGARVSGTHPLEAYVSVNRCRGLPRGTFHYDPVLHTLTLLHSGEAELAELLQCTQAAAGLSGPPAAVLTLTARFSRATWKYSGQGYALVLRDSGAAIQLLSLVAAALGLATVAVGTGDIEVGPRTVGTDWRVESTVGQLVLGTHPASPTG